MFEPKVKRDYLPFIMLKSTRFKSELQITQLFHFFFKSFFSAAFFPPFFFLTILS